ncbi:MAG: acyltransferase family protein [Microthrixaceae bacterium]
MVEVSDRASQVEPPRAVAVPQAFRADIQGLRGLAILGVVAYHVGVPVLQGGFTGVDVFFVLSGYLITGLLIKEFQNSGRVSLLRFSARRIRRLLPASAVVLLATLVVAALVYSPLELKSVSRTGQAVSAYVSNMFFGLKAQNYLRGDSSSNPFLQTWSLAVEEQFYLVWPLTLALLMWLGRRWLSVRRALAAGIVAVAVVSFGLSIVLMSKRQNWAFFAAPPRFWEFAIGGLAAMVPVNAMRRRHAATVAGCAGLILVAFSMVAYNATTPFPGWTAMVPVLGTVLILVAGVSDASPVSSRLLSGRVVGWFGQYSYSWYLWHWPMLVFAGLLWPASGRWWLALVALLSLIPSVASFHLVEQRVRYNRWLSSRTGPTIIGGLAVTLVCFGAATLVLRSAEARSSSPNQELFLNASRDIPKVFPSSCLAVLSDTETDPICSTDSLASSRAIVLFGDSHAGHWAPALSLVAEKQGLRLILLTKASCPYAKVELFNAKLGRQYDECSEWREWALDKIREIDPAYVVMSNYGSYVSRTGKVSRLEVPSEAWRGGVRSTFDELHDAGIPFFAIADIPDPGFDVPACLSRSDGAIIGGRDCRFDRARSLGIPQAEIESEAAATFGGTWLDFTDVICPSSICDPWRGGLVLYSDENHMTDTFNRTLAPVLGDRLESR